MQVEGMPLLIAGIIGINIFLFIMVIILQSMKNAVERLAQLPAPAQPHAPVAAQPAADTTACVALAIAAALRR